MKGKPPQSVSPICRRRVEEYPELEYVRDIAETEPERLSEVDREDLIDASHQWAVRFDGSLYQNCFDCPERRRKPLEDFDERTQVWLLQKTLERTGGTE